MVPRSRYTSLLIAGTIVGSSSFSAACAFVPSYGSALAPRSSLRTSRGSYRPAPKPTVHKLSAPRSQQSSNGEGGIKNGKSRWSEGVLLGGWCAAIGSFIVANYFSDTCWPSCLVRVPRRVWVLVHAFSGMLFSGGIVVSTLVEWLVVRSRSPSVVSFWFTKVSGIDRAVVLPALTASVASGAAQSALEYGVGLKFAPRHVKSTIHTLALFAIWWAATDLTTQKSTRRSVPAWCEANEGRTAAPDVPPVLHFRRRSNVVSCLFVAVIYALMALKPGYPL